MRAFLSLDIENEEVLREMVDAQGELARTGADLKLVERQNLHFTVKFFGEIPDSRIEEVDKRIKSVELKQADVRVAGVGAFPDLRRPRVVWAGVASQDVTSVTNIAVAVIKAVEGIGQPEDHTYHPHITLARIRSERNKQELVGYLERNRERMFGASRLRTLKLKSSTLTPRGPTYSEVKVYPLG
ncbi:MAG: RNA 2',3'-cyclic phosphodiesterase [Thaumarchaeota archaeon]|nr:RNA 2',3'-cyclic phosphodiesterase [Nitrososphaerota archaeon]MCS4539349.1 RNA 2',3'-cyclic phosphodiesterase [Nitrososphaerota archaeon]